MPLLKNPKWLLFASNTSRLKFSLWEIMTTVIELVSNAEKSRDFTFYIYGFLSFLVK